MSKLKAILYLAFYIITFIIIPLMAYSYIVTQFPPQIIQMFEATIGTTMENILINMILIGIFYAVLSIVKSLTHPQSKLNMAACLLSSIVSIYLIIFAFSLGNPQNLGLIRRQSSILYSGVPMEVTVEMNLQVIILTLAAIIVAKALIDTFIVIRERSKG